MKPHVARMVLPVLVLPVLAAGVLQAQVAAPRVGIIRCSDGSVRAVYGLAGNFVLAHQPFATADAASFSDQAGLLAKNGTIRLVAPNGVLEGEYESHEAKPLLNVDGESTSAIAWLPAAHAILRWSGTAFRLFPVAPGTITGQVTSIRAIAQDRAELLELNSDRSSLRATITLSSGNLTSLDAVPGATGPAFAQHAGFLFHDDKQLIVETPNGVRQALPVSGNVAVERMSSNWLHLSSAGTHQHWALHLDGSQAQLFVLPNISKEESAK